MPHISRTQQEAQSRIRQLAGSGLPPGELSDQLLKALLAAIPADEAVLFGIDPGSLLINRLLAIVGNEPNGTLFWLRHIYLAREPIAELIFPSLMARNVRVAGLHDRPEACWGVPTAVFSHLSAREFRNAYRDVGSPAGGGLRAWFEVDGRKIGALQMMRSDAARPFRVSDWQLLGRLIPMTGRVLALALTREQALTGTAGNPLATGVLAITPQGRITMQSPTCEPWMRVLADRGGASSEAPGLSGIPVVVWSAIAGLHAAANSGAMHSALRVRTELGPLRVEASPAGEDGEIVVTLVPERPAAPPELPQSWHLTAQERKVLSLVASGMTNRQIAQMLVVSENTVESHLRHAYEKLDVKSRTQYLARLFREVYWPLQDPN
jgi:DNA-binding CsgD family transcriptional regulator